MSWLGRLRFWTTDSRFAQIDAGPPVSLEARIGTAETELREITRDVYAVLRDVHPRLHADP